MNTTRSGGGETWNIFLHPLSWRNRYGLSILVFVLQEFGRWLTKVGTALNKKSMHICCQCIFAPPSSSRCCTKMGSMWSNTSESINQLTSTWSVCLFSIPPHLQVVVEGGGWRCPCAHLSLWERSLVKASRIWPLPCETRTHPFFRSFRNPYNPSPNSTKTKLPSTTPKSLLVICTKYEQHIRHLKIGDVCHCTERSHGRHANQPLPSAFYASWA